ncbi:MAG: DUF2182 domain-containing protein [Caulobacterales bacterium]
MSETPSLEQLLKRDRVISLLGLALLCVLAWAYIASGAGMGMSARDMTTFSLFPHTEPQTEMAPDAMPGMSMPSTAPMDAMPMAATGWSVSTVLLVVAMWWVMMIAMMIPSAAPAVLLYARVYRHAAKQGQIEQKAAPTGPFVAGYLLVWLAFSVMAASLQRALVQAGLVSEMMMTSQSRWLSGGLLIVAGLYEISPLKGLCLDHCRSPIGFLTKNWRPGAAGAARLGVLHGAYCVGCCWALMALLFVGGVMNLLWIAMLAALALIEKVAPGGPWIGRGLGVALIVWGVVVVFV